MSRRTAKLPEPAKGEAWLVCRGSKRDMSDCRVWDSLLHLSKGQLIFTMTRQPSSGSTKTQQQIRENAASELERFLVRFHCTCEGEQAEAGISQRQPSIAAQSCLSKTAAALLPSRHNPATSHYSICLVFSTGLNCFISCPDRVPAFRLRAIDQQGPREYTRKHDD